MGRHLSQLQTLFQDPISNNIHWREIESLLHHLGASIEPAHGSRFRVQLNQKEDYLHHPHQTSTCSKQLIKQVRQFLTDAGIKPDVN